MEVGRAWEGSMKTFFEVTNTGLKVDCMTLTFVRILSDYTGEHATSLEGLTVNSPAVTDFFTARINTTLHVTDQALPDYEPVHCRPPQPDPLGGCLTSAPSSSLMMRKRLSGFPTNSELCSQAVYFHNDSATRVSTSVLGTQHFSSTGTYWLSSARSREASTSRVQLLLCSLSATLTSN